MLVLFSDMRYQGGNFPSEGHSELRVFYWLQVFARKKHKELLIYIYIYLLHTHATPAWVIKVTFKPTGSDNTLLFTTHYFRGWEITIILKVQYWNHMWWIMTWMFRFMFRFFWAMILGLDRCVLCVLWQKLSKDACLLAMIHSALVNP